MKWKAKHPLVYLIIFFISLAALRISFAFCAIVFVVAVVILAGKSNLFKKMPGWIKTLGWILLLVVLVKFAPIGLGSIVQYNDNTPVSEDKYLMRSVEITSSDSPDPVVRDVYDVQYKTLSEAESNGVAVWSCYEKMVFFGGENGRTFTLGIGAHEGGTTLSCKTMGSSVYGKVYLTGGAAPMNYRFFFENEDGVTNTHDIELGDTSIWLPWVGDDSVEQKIGFSTKQENPKLSWKMEFSVPAHKFITFYGMTLGGDSR